MSVRRFRTSTTRGARRRAAVGLLALGLAAGTLSGCDSTAPDGPDGPSPAAASGSAEPEPFRLRSNVSAEQAVPVDTAVELSASGGALTAVRVTSPAGALTGKLTDGGASWRAHDLPEPGTQYRVRAVAERADGKRVVRTSRFRTQALTLDQQTYPSVAPLEGETVGVGMPVIVTFDVPVTDRASIEEHMAVRATPRQQGSWYWLSDTEAHWRPKTYWKAGSEVSVDVDINSVHAGNGIYGQESRSIDFTVGEAHVYKVDTRTHQMRVFQDGDLLRTIPITVGKPGFTTRSGTKVIMEKFDVKRMNSETVGIGEDNPEYYDIDDVQWAMRLTYSGEFIHAAPWSVGSQGQANVSHGCTGMSTENAAWLYAMTRRGDVVEYTGTDRPMTLDNGYGDWNASWSEWLAGSALA